MDAVNMEEMTTAELAKRKVELMARLTAIAHWNTYGKSIRRLTIVEVERIDTQTELVAVLKEIERRIEGE